MNLSKEYELHKNSRAFNDNALSWRKMTQHWSSRITLQVHSVTVEIPKLEPCCWLASLTLDRVGYLAVAGPVLLRRCSPDADFLSGIAFTSHPR